MLQLDEPKMEVAAVMVGGKVDACAAEVAELHNATLLVHGKVKICTLSNTQNLCHGVQFHSFLVEIGSVVNSREGGSFSHSLLWCY